MDKWIAGFLQAGGAVLFFVAGAIGDEASLLLLAPAVASSVSGMLLWGRDRSAAQPPVVAPREAPRSIEGKVDRIEDTLVALQRELSDLREDRDFFRDLYAESAGRPRLKS